MKVLGIKQSWRQWIAAILVVVISVMTPFQTVAEHGNSFQAVNDVEEDEILLVDDRAFGNVWQGHTPSDSELDEEEDWGHSTPSDAESEDDMELSTPSDSELGEDIELERSTPSDINLMSADNLYCVKFYVDSELWDVQDVERGGRAQEPDRPSKDGYTFVGWSADYTNVARHLSARAQFVKGTYETHRVTFIDYDGSWLANAQYVINGQDASRPSSPKRDGYTFVGWDNQRFCIKKDTVITAQYQKGDLKTYFLQYKGRCPDKDGSYNLLKEEWVVEGQDGSPPESEVIPGYTFCRWPDSEFYTNVRRDYTIHGKYYTGDVETYKVEFVDYDGRMLYAPQQIACGQDASRPSSPKRDGYTFVGWDNQRFCIKKDTVITAQYQKGDLKTYFLQYKGRCPDKDGYFNLLKEEWVVEGQDGSPPESEVIPGYTFCGWPDSEYYTNVQEDYTIRGEYYAGDVETYKVEFVDYDGRMLYAPQQIARGQDASRPSSPKRDGYTFVGWDNQRFCIKKDTVITAQYQKGDLKTYFLQYKGRCPDKDGYFNLLKEEWVVEGQDGSPPESEVIPGYTFCRWPDSEYYTNVQEDYTIRGEYYAGDVETYKVEFVDYDGRMLYAPQQIARGQDASRPSSPKRDGYTFVGWDNQRFCIKKDTVITAQYQKGDLKTYFLQYKGRCPDKDGFYNLLKEEWVVEGQDGSPPESELIPGYTFCRWPDSEFYTNVRRNYTIFGKYYTGDVETYKVEFVDYDGRMLYAPQYITEGAEPDVPKNPTRDGYTFTGWDKTFYQITAPIKIRAVYIPGTHNTHKVKFYGKITGVQSWVVLKEAQVPTGYDASAPIPPVYAGYVFTGWDSSYTNIQSNKYIYASYQSEDSVTGTNKLRIYKTLLSKLDLSDELEDALIQLGEYLANADNDGPTSRSLVVSGELIVLIATLIYSCGVYLARPLFKSIANCITTCFGHVADAVVDAIEAELEVLINEGESEAIAIGLGDIAGQYGLFECKEAADAMAEYLRKQKQEFKFITMKYPAYSSGYIISFTREALFGINSEESIISKNGYHYGIEYYGIVYCNVHPLGLPRAVWEADFWGDGQAERTITPP